MGLALFEVFDLAHRSGGAARLFILLSPLRAVVRAEILDSQGARPRDGRPHGCMRGQTQVHDGRRQTALVVQGDGVRRATDPPV